MTVDIRSAQRAWFVALALLAITAAMTWPMARVWRPELPNLPDASFNVWRLAWVAHQLVAAPTQLFEGNIFFPATHALAYSDAMLLMGFMGAPLIWVGVHPFVVHNLLVVGAFWSASYFTYCLCLRVTSDGRAAIIGALVAGFAPYRFGHIAHLELLWTAFLPLGLGALLSVYERPSARRALRLSLWVVLQTLCSIYYGIFFAIYLGLAACGLAVGRSRTDLVQVGAALAAAAAIALVTLLPYVLIYRDAKALVEGRTADEIARFSATASDYLHVSPQHALPLPQAAEAAEERSLYPGAIAVALALVAVVIRPARAALYGLLLVLSVDLSLGSNGLLYPVLLEMQPTLNSLRAPARFGALVILSLSVLASLGAATVLSSRRAPRLVALAIAVGMVVEYWAAPLGTRYEPTTPPGLYTWLAQQPKGVVVELPLPVPEALWGNETEYQLMSIYHWQPLLNGYSGNAPRAYVDFLNSMRTFPADDSLEMLRARHVRWIIVHEPLFKGPAFAALMERVVESEWLRSVGTYTGRWGRATVLEIIATSL